MKIFFLCLTPIFFLAMMISNPVFSEVIDPRLELIENTKDLRYADLKHMDLKNKDLSGADLYGANLSGADL